MGGEPGGASRRGRGALGDAPLSPLRPLSLVGGEFVPDRHALRASHDPAAPVLGERSAGGNGVVGVSERADAFFVAPYTRGEIRFHVTGAVLNGVVWMAGLLWLFAHWKAGGPHWPSTVIAILA